MKRSLLNSIPGLFCLALTILTLSVSGQPDTPADSKRDVVKAHKIAFLTDRLSLTPEEAQRFWPVYNEYQDKKEIVQKEMFKGMDLRDMDIDVLTDEEATEIADNQIIKAQKLLDVQKEYHIKFKEVLPIQKVLKLYQAEKDFQHELLRKMREDHGPVPQQQPDQRW
ncbi:MAG: hypothetical protein PHD61_04510 [Bacteroidales bacterium]|nr:hypothetical protein [Lentimicrobiaceae bacterium]MDD5694551.1 hypothetical protein [Bacteroidales bacterium]